MREWIDRTLLEAAATDPRIELVVGDLGFGVVEEFILPFVLDHVRPSLDKDDYRVRAFLQFASEEAKHIQLFKIFSEDFQNGFGSECSVIGPPAAVADAVLSHQALAVALVFSFLLVFVAMPVKYIGVDESLVRVVGVAHGWLYIVYLVTGDVEDLNP